MYDDKFYHLKIQVDGTNCEILQTTNKKKIKYIFRASKMTRITLIRWAIFSHKLYKCFECGWNTAETNIQNYIFGYIYILYYSVKDGVH